MSSAPGSGIHKNNHRWQVAVTLPTDSAICDSAERLGAYRKVDEAKLDMLREW